MIIQTPPLSVKSVNVFPALFKAQLPDTLNAIRQSIPEWVAVHVVGEQVGTSRRGSSPDEIRSELKAQLSPMATLYDPIYQLTTPALPPHTIATFVPDRVRPTFAPQYEHWKFIYYPDSRTVLEQFFDRALGGIPEGPVGMADALIKGKIRGQAVLEGWSGSVGVPAFKRTMEAVIDLAGPVVFWDSAFGFESTGEVFLKYADFVLGLFGAKEDRLYFDAAEYSWFVVVSPGGPMRVGLLG
jgi:hypothetical protein